MRNYEKIYMIMNDDVKWRSIMAQQIDQAKIVPQVGA
jgi:hypothetical protein